MNDNSILTGSITEIRPQVRDSTRLNVFIGDQFAFGIDQRVAADFNLRAGAEVDESLAREILAADEAYRCRAAAINLLAQRGRSTAEMRSRLSRKGYSDGAINLAIERLIDIGYLDDEEFARSWVRNRAEHRPRGGRLLRAELRQKGIQPDMVDQVIDDENIDEVAAAIDLAKRRIVKLQSLEPEVRRRRLIGFLQRRGFGWDAVRQAVEAATNPNEEEEIS